jgi:hypothetical protein
MNGGDVDWISNRENCIGENLIQSTAYDQFRFYNDISHLIGW